MHRQRIGEAGAQRFGMGFAALGLVAACGLAAAPLLAQDAAFGDAQSVAYAEDLWTALEDARLAGDRTIEARPYKGTEPHGAVLETLMADIDVGGHSGRAIVKRNYGPAGVEPSQVWSDPATHLGAVTVMYRRDQGYAPDHGNWFWAKYLPDGSLDRSPDDVPLAGKVGSCITCHEAAAGGDYIYSNDSQ